MKNKKINIPISRYDFLGDLKKSLGYKKPKRRKITLYKKLIAKSKSLGLILERVPHTEYGYRYELSEINDKDYGTGCFQTLKEVATELESIESKKCRNLK